MKKDLTLQKFHQQSKTILENLEKEYQSTTEFYDAYLKGDNKIYQKYLKETKEFDEEWIKTVESYIPSLNAIVSNPKTSLKQEEDIVAVEKAKKINSATIRHLAANTQYVKEVNKEGMVIPTKILTSFTEIDHEIYENRVIVTLIERLFFFIRNRYEIIKENVLSFEKRHFNLESSFPINNTQVDVKLDLILTDELTTKINEYNKALLVRVEHLNKLISGLYNSEFMVLMKNSRRVNPPLMKTNIFLKDINYKNAYLLWIFLDRYNTLAFTVHLEEKHLPFDKEYEEDLNRQVLMLFNNVTSNQTKLASKYDQIKPSRKRRKSLKVVTKHKDDLDINLDNEQMEDNSLNEYYLATNRALFKQSLEYYETTSKTYETSLKRALRETLNISNALYESFFELEENDDIFTRLITEVDVTKELTEARRKALISRMIREVKQVDYNNALRRERKYLNEIAKFDGLLLKEVKAKEKLTKRDIATVKRLKKEAERVKLNEKETVKKLKVVKQNEDKIKVERITTNEKIRVYQAKLNEDLKNELEQYKNQLKVAFDEDLASVKEKYAIETRLTKTRLNNEIKKLNNRLKREQAKAKKLKEERSIKQKQSTLIRETKLSNEKKKKVIDRFNENDENIKKLDQHKKHIEKEIKKLGINND